MLCLKRFKKGLLTCPSFFFGDLIVYFFFLSLIIVIKNISYISSISLFFPLHLLNGDNTKDERRYSCNSYECINTHVVSLLKVSLAH